MKVLVLLGFIAAVNAVAIMEVYNEEWDNFKVSRQICSSLYISRRLKIYLLTLTLYYDAVSLLGFVEKIKTKITENVETFKKAKLLVHSVNKEVRLSTLPLLAHIQS